MKTIQINVNDEFTYTLILIDLKLLLNFLTVTLLRQAQSDDTKIKTNTWKLQEAVCFQPHYWVIICIKNIVTLCFDLNAKDKSFSSDGQQIDNQ